MFVRILTKSHGLRALLSVVCCLALICGLLVILLIALLWESSQDNDPNLKFIFLSAVAATILGAADPRAVYRLEPDKRKLVVRTGYCLAIQGNRTKSHMASRISLR
jgi:hypothetical protein